MKPVCRMGGTCETVPDSAGYCINCGEHWSVKPVTISIGSVDDPETHPGFIPQLTIEATTGNVSELRTAERPYRWEDVRVGDVIRDLQEQDREGDLRVRELDGDTADLYVIDAPWRTRRYHRSLWENVSTPCIMLVSRKGTPRAEPPQVQDADPLAEAKRRVECRRWGSAMYWHRVGEAGKRTRGDILAAEAAGEKA